MSWWRRPSACSTPRRWCRRSTFGWTLTDAPTIAAARLDGAVGQLERILGPSPDGIDRANELLARAVAPLEPWGRALFAGTLAHGLPGTPLGDLFRLGDQLREFRGDSHIAAWVAAGHDATEIGLLTELYWGMPTRTYVRTRAWTDAQLDAAEARLTEAGLMQDGAAHRRPAAPTESRSSSPPTPRWPPPSRPWAATSRSSTTCSGPGPQR